MAGAIVVTTPQQVSLADTRRAVAMYKKLNIPPLGLVENMSHFVCPDCGHEADIFGRGGGEQLAAEVNVPFLGRIPIYQPIREGGDTGVPLMVSEPDSPAAQAFMAVAERTAAQLSIASYNRPATIPGLGRSSPAAGRNSKIGSSRSWPDPRQARHPCAAKYSPGGGRRCDGAGERSSQRS